MVTQSERFIPPTFEATMSQIKFVSRIRDTNQIHEFKMPVVLREPTGGTAVLICELQNVTQKVRTCHPFSSGFVVLSVYTRWLPRPWISSSALAPSVSVRSSLPAAVWGICTSSS